jgi:hypothetical protein
MAGSVEIRERAEVGPADAPGIAQILDIVANTQLVQYQVYVSMQDADDPTRRAVLELMLTCTREQVNQTCGDFGDFVRSVRSRSAGGGSHRASRFAWPDVVRASG